VPPYIVPTVVAFQVPFVTVPTLVMLSCVALGNVDEIVGTIYGGTGLNSYSQGDTLYSSASNTLAALPKDTNATRYLSNTGTSNNPAWSQVNLTNGVTGALPIGNGGTGQTTQTAAFDALAPTTTQGDIIYRNASNNVRLAAGTSGFFLKTQGAGANPIWAQAGGVLVVVVDLVIIILVVKVVVAVEVLIFQHGFHYLY